MSTSLNRRKLLKYGFGGVTVALGGGLVWRASERGVFSTGQGEAYELWDRWQSENQDGLMSVVEAGILAASAHNTQPWRFDVKPGKITLSADLTRQLGPFDPFRREMYLSLGCALENMVQAAMAQGLSPEIVPATGHLEMTSPTEGTRTVATLELRSADTNEPYLADSIPERHTNRGAYIRARSLTTSQRTEMQELANGFGSNVNLRVFDNDDTRDELGDLIISATEDIIADPEMGHASAAWFRFDPEQIEVHRDGVTLDTVGLPPVTNALAKMLPAPSEQAAHAQWLTSTRDRHVATSPAFGVVQTRDLYDIKSTLDAGRLWQRLHLWATANGLAAHPLNQPTEMVDRERALNKPARTAAAFEKILGDDEWAPTFVFRIGHPEIEARPSPRRPARAVMVA